MTTQMSVWIDHKQVIVLDMGAGIEITKIAFETTEPLKQGRETQPKKSYTPRDFIAEDRKGQMRNANPQIGLVDS